MEISDRWKEKFKRDYDLDFDHWGPGLTIEDEAEVTLKMWKAEVRRSSRYVPDYHESKLQRYNLTHDGNIKVGVKARDEFNRTTTTLTYFQKVEERHEGYIKFQQRNYIPRIVSKYWRILNDPPLAAFERCIPISLYYWEICRDSPGCIPPQLQSFNLGHGSSSSNHSNHTNHRSAQVRSSRANSTDQASSRHNSSRSNHNKSASCSRHESRNNSAWHTSSSTDRQNALRAPQEVEQDLATLVNWTNEHVRDDDHQYPHRPDLMTLDDITEINRLTELIDNIRSGNPPITISLCERLKFTIFAGSWCVAQTNPHHRTPSSIPKTLKAMS
jgi:hypothetical protein